MRPEFQDIVEDVSRLLTRPATLEDRDFNLVAFCSHEAPIDQVRLESILHRHSRPEVREWFERFGIATAAEPVRTPGSEELGIRARLCLPARWRGVTYGYLWLLDEAGIDPERVPDSMALAERAGSLMAQQTRTRDELAFKLQDLLENDPDSVERAAHDLHELGIIRRRTPVAVVELAPTAPDPAEAPPMNLWRLPRSVLAASLHGRTTLLVPTVDADLAPVREVARQALDLHIERAGSEDAAGVVAGIGDVRSDATEARASWREARLATRVGRHVPGLRPLAAWPELGVHRLLACGPGPALAGAVLDPAVVRLLEHDDPELQHTAVAWLEAGGRAQETAHGLNVHRQTVYYRMQRVEQITGLDLSRGDQRLLLHLGLTLAPVLPGGDGG